jgi:hypothetical protein
MPNLETPNLKLPYLAAGQAQKHVTHNDALQVLDSLTQLSVLDRHVTTPPTAPAEGARYIIPAGANGVWAGQSGKIASWDGVAWAIHAPRAGWTVWIADEAAAAVWNDVDWQPLTPPVRERLTANRSYFVRTGGSFLTIQKAINTVASLDLSTFSVTIQVADGTYGSGASVAGPWLGSGSVSLVGNPTTPANCIVSTTNAACVAVSTNGTLMVSGFEFRTTSSGSGLSASNGGTINLTGAVRFGACASFHMDASAGGRIAVGANYTVAGATNYHWAASSTGTIICIGRTVTITGTPAFSAGWAYAGRVGVIDCQASSFSGAITGWRYYAEALSMIFTNGGGPNYLPGSSAGSAVTGSQYV